MSYRSDLVIAVHKQIITEDLINPIIPVALKNEPFCDTELARYWKLEGWKWYESYPEVQEIEAFFNRLDEHELPIRTSNVDPTLQFEIGPYGALRIGEDHDDSQQWGDPGEYGVHLKRTIVSPFIDSPADTIA